MKAILENNFSNHAIRRTQQRGIRPWAVNFIMAYADKYKYANQNCISQFVSHRKIRKLIKEKVILEDYKISLETNFSNNYVSPGTLIRVNK